MRWFLTVTLCVVAASLAIVWPVAAADRSDGKALMVCAVTAINECTVDGKCGRGAAQEGNNLPTFIRVDVGAKTLSADDGSDRKTEIKASSAVNGQLMLQGIENGKPWNMVIKSGTGRWGGSVVEDDGSFALFGACTLPQAREGLPMRARAWVMVLALLGSSGFQRQDSPQ
jgi:hypothetical protein